MTKTDLRKIQTTWGYRNAQREDFTAGKSLLAISNVLRLGKFLDPGIQGAWLRIRELPVVSHLGKECVAFHYLAINEQTGQPAPQSQECFVPVTNFLATDTKEQYWVKTS